MLHVWLDCVRRAGIRNFFIVALDAELHEHLTNVRDPPVPSFFYDMNADPIMALHAADNHGISSLKFRLLGRMLRQGYTVLLSDVDVCTTQDPFGRDAKTKRPLLYRDSDVEGLSDGFDPNVAYGKIKGFDDPTMGWARYAQGVYHMVFNSGLFLVRPRRCTVELMQRVTRALEKRKEWDQSRWNMELFYLTHNDYKNPGCSTRVMDIHTFVNSKVMFKTLRNKKKHATPAMVHINYHPDKWERLKAVRDFYFGERDAASRKRLMAFPGGSEPGT